MEASSQKEEDNEERSEGETNHPADETFYFTQQEPPSSSTTTSPATINLSEKENTVMPSTLSSMRLLDATSFPVVEPKPESKAEIDGVESPLGLLTQSEPEDLLTQSPSAANDGSAVVQVDSSQSPMHSHDNNDESSTDSSSDDDDSDSESSLSVNDNNEPMSLLERRARNMERNRDLLSNLGLAYGHSISLKRTTKKTTTVDDEASQESVKRGMLLTINQFSASDDDATRSMEDIQKRYPHREGQVRKLSALLNSTAVGHAKNRFVPAPIFVTGPSGSGKTAVVQNVLQVVKKRASINTTSSGNQEAKTVSAYINCCALDVASCDDVVRSAYRQFELELQDPTKQKAHKKKKRQRHKKKKEDTKNSPQPSKSRLSLSSTNSSPFANKDVDDNSVNSEMEERIEQLRTRKRKSLRSSKTDVAASSKMAASTTAQDIAATPETSMNALTVAHTFGLLLNAILEDRHHGILILDHADRLASLPARKGLADRSNVLAQLLLLPRTLNLNLTMVLITNSILLEHSRLNAHVSSQTSLSNISEDVQPIRVHFPPYRGKNVIKEIMKQSNVRRLIVGENWECGANIIAPTFKQSVYESFLDTLIQSLHDVTTDIKEYIRFGRTLWLNYTEPLQSHTIDKTLDSIRKSLSSSGGLLAGTESTSLVQREILSLLGRRFLPQLRLALERGLFTFGSSCAPSVAETKQLSFHEMPSLTKYLLLAAFLCQLNRPDRDRHLFSIQKNGRRRQSMSENTGGEDLAFGSSNQGQQLKTLRPRTFPLERMLSVYVSLVGLNEGESSNTVDHDEKLRSLGTTSLNACLADLCSMGILYEHPSRSPTNPVRMSEPRYACSLTKEEAEEIAKSLNLPLDRYIL